MNLRRFPTLAGCFVGMEQEPNNHFLSTFVSFNCYSSCFSHWMTVRKFNCSCTGGPCALLLLLSSRIWISRRTFWSMVSSPSTLECSKLLLMPTSFMFNKRAGYCFLAKVVSELFPPCLNPYLPLSVKQARVLFFIEDKNPVLDQRHARDIWDQCWRFNTYTHFCAFLCARI